MTDHMHTLMIINMLINLHNRESVVRYTKISNDLNALYTEGVNATYKKHYKERVFTDLGFG